MPTKNLIFIDWTDAARHGAHTSVYVDGEELESLELVIHPLKPAGQRPKVVEYNPGERALQMWGVYQYTMPQGNIAYLASGLRSKYPIPDFFVMETSWKVYVANENVPYLGCVDFDFAQWYAYQNEYASVVGPSPFQFCMNWTSNNLQMGVRKASYQNSGLGLVVNVVRPPSPTGYWRAMAYKRDNGIGGAYFLESGEFIACGFLRKAEITNFTKKQRFAIGYGYATFTQAVYMKYLLVSDYKFSDWMQQGAVSVVTTGTVESAGSAKIALTDAVENSRIVLAPGTYIEIDLTGIAKDVSIFDIAVVCDSTDTNSLTAKIATNAMYPVWSVGVPLGSTSTQRASGEKITDSWTNSLRHIFYPEIQYLCGLSFYSDKGCRYIRLENNTVATTIRVNEVRVSQGVDDMGYFNADAPNDIIYNYKIPTADVPIGATGAVQTLYVKNSSAQDTASAFVKMSGDGFYDAGVAVLEYAAAPGGPWYDKLNLPPNPDGVQIGPVMPEGLMPFYVRAKLPSAGSLFQTLTANFTVKITNT